MFAKVGTVAASRARNSDGLKGGLVRGWRPRRSLAVSPLGRWPGAQAGTAQDARQRHRGLASVIGKVAEVEGQNDVGIAGEGRSENVAVLGVTPEALDEYLEAHNLGLRNACCMAVRVRRRRARSLSRPIFVVRARSVSSGIVPLQRGSRRVPIGESQQQAGEVVGNEDAGVEHRTAIRVDTIWSSSSVPVCANSASPAALREPRCSMNRLIDSRLIRRCAASNSKMPSRAQLHYGGPADMEKRCGLPVVRKQDRPRWTATSLPAASSSTTRMIAWRRLSLITTVCEPTPATAWVSSNSARRRAVRGADAAARSRCSSTKCISNERNVR